LLLRPLGHAGEPGLVAIVILGPLAHGTPCLPESALGQAFEARNMITTSGCKLDEGPELQLQRHPLLAPLQAVLLQQVIGDLPLRPTALREEFGLEPVAFGRS
jgi:hypothetical protein